MKDRILKEWKILSDKIEGEVSFKENIQANIEGYILKLEIVKEVYKGKITIKQTIMVYSENNLQFTPIVINYKAKSKRNLNLQIWKKGFVERIFNSGLKTGDELIDKKYCIKSNSQRDASMLLKIPELRNYFLTQEEFYFNIDTKKGEVIVIFKINKLKNIVNTYMVLKAIIKEIKF